MPDEPAPHAFTIFSDDIRFENNGKSILIGVYGNDLIVPSFPFAQPLWIMTNLVIPVEIPFKSCVFRIYKNSEIIVEIKTKWEGFETSREAAIAAVEQTPWPGQEELPPGEESAKIIQAKFIFRIDSLTVSGPCTLRARWKIDEGNTIKAGSLAIVSQAEIDPKAGASLPGTGAPKLQPQSRPRKRTPARARK